MTKYALDSNIVSYVISDRYGMKDKLASVVEEGHHVTITPIAYYEVKRGLLYIQSKRRYRVFQDLVALIGVGWFDHAVLDCAAQLYVQCRENGHTTEDADIFIAAFCILHGYTLVTNNTKHFAHMPLLEIENWVEDAD